MYRRMYSIVESGGRRVSVPIMDGSKVGDCLVLRGQTHINNGCEGWDLIGVPRRLFGDSWRGSYGGFVGCRIAGGVMLVAVVLALPVSNSSDVIREPSRSWDHGIHLRHSPLSNTFDTA